MGCSLGHWRSDWLWPGITELELCSTSSSLYTTSYRAWWSSAAGPVLLFLSCCECLLSERPCVPQRMATCTDNSTAIKCIGAFFIGFKRPLATNAFAKSFCCNLKLTCLVSHGRAGQGNPMGKNPCYQATYNYAPIPNPVYIFSLSLRLVFNRFLHLIPDRN